MHFTGNESYNYPLYAIPKHLLEFTDEPLNDKKQIEMCKFTQCLKANHATKCRFADCMPWKLRSLHLDFNQKQLIVCQYSSIALLTGVD